MSFLLLQTVVDDSQSLYALLLNYKYECRVYEGLEAYKAKEVDKGWIINAYEIIRYYSMGHGKLVKDFN